MKAKRKTNGDVKVTMSENEAEILRGVCRAAFSRTETDDVSEHIINTLHSLSVSLSDAQVPVKWKYRKRVLLEVFYVNDGKVV